MQSSFHLLPPFLLLLLLFLLFLFLLLLFLFLLLHLLYVITVDVRRCTTRPQPDLALIDTRLQTLPCQKHLTPSSPPHLPPSLPSPSLSSVSLPRSMSFFIPLSPTALHTALK